MALRLNKVASITKLTQEGFEHPANPLGYLRFLGKHGQITATKVGAFIT
jgi:hypothetical protein